MKIYFSLFKIRSFCITLMCLLLFLSLQGCSMGSGAARLGWKGYDWDGKLFSTKQAPGTNVLDAWRDYDIDVRKFLREYRRPDYVMTKGSVTQYLYLYYVEEDVVVTFVRGFSGTEWSTKKIEPDLRDALLALE